MNHDQTLMFTTVHLYTKADKPVFVARQKIRPEEIASQTPTSVTFKHVGVADCFQGNVHVYQVS